MTIAYEARTLTRHDMDRGEILVDVDRVLQYLGPLQEENSCSKRDGSLTMELMLTMQVH